MGMLAVIPTFSDAAPKGRLLLPQISKARLKSAKPRHLSDVARTGNTCKILSTKKWFQHVVIGEKLCPFAAPLLREDKLLRIVSSTAQNSQEAVQDIQREVQDLVDNSESDHETTLVVMEKHSFVEDYLEFVRLSWTLQEEAIAPQFQDKLQLVLFHPNATHQTYAADLEDDSPADYTIRSPYPTIHLLREEDVLKAVQSGYPGLEYLPSRNKAKLMEQGIAACRKRLQECYISSRDR